MSERPSALKRLSAVYQLLEETHLIETRRALGHVTEAQNVVQAESARSIEARASGRDALTREDRLGHSLAILGDELARRRRKQLEPVLELRKQQSEEARMRYLEARSWNERIKSLTNDALKRAAAVDARRTQAVIDDRFLARRQWQQATGNQFRCEDK